MTNPAVCFTCGLPTGDPLRLNHLPSGQVCTACRDRLLDLLPAPFPARPTHLRYERGGDGYAYDDGYGEVEEPELVRVRRRPRDEEPA
jgi:hypothetical protein